MSHDTQSKSEEPPDGEESDGEPFPYSSRKGMTGKPDNSLYPGSEGEDLQDGSQSLTWLCPYCWDFASEDHADVLEHILNTAKNSADPHKGKSRTTLDRDLVAVDSDGAVQKIFAAIPRNEGEDILEISDVQPPLILGDDVPGELVLDTEYVEDIRSYKDWARQSETETETMDSEELTPSGEPLEEVIEKWLCPLCSKGADTLTGLKQHVSIMDDEAHKGIDGKTPRQAYYAVDDTDTIVAVSHPKNGGMSDGMPIQDAPDEYRDPSIVVDDEEQEEEEWVEMWQCPLCFEKRGSVTGVKQHISKLTDGPHKGIKSSDIEDGIYGYDADGEIVAVTYPTEGGFSDEMPIEDAPPEFQEPNMEGSAGEESTRPKYPEKGVVETWVCPYCGEAKEAEGEDHMHDSGHGIRSHINRSGGVHEEYNGFAPTKPIPGYTSSDGLVGILSETNDDGDSVWIPKEDIEASVIESLPGDEESAIEAYTADAEENSQAGGESVSAFDEISGEKKPKIVAAYRAGLAVAESAGVEYNESESGPLRWPPIKKITDSSYPYVDQVQEEVQSGRITPALIEEDLNREFYDKALAVLVAAYYDEMDLGEAVEAFENDTLGMDVPEELSFENTELTGDGLVFHEDIEPVQTDSDGSVSDDETVSGPEGTGPDEQLQTAVAGAEAGHAEGSGDDTKGALSALAGRAEQLDLKGEDAFIKKALLRELINEAETELEKVE
jgi:rubredoxin